MATFIFILLGIILLIVNTNGWFVIPVICIYITFGIAILIVIVNIISYLIAKSKIDKFKKMFRCRERVVKMKPFEDWTLGEVAKVCSSFHWCEECIFFCADLNQPSSCKLVTDGDGRFNNKMFEKENENE